MIAVLQRIRSCSVTADGEPYSECGAGLLVLLGVSKDDGEEDAKLLCEKISVLRIFCDGDDKMNLSVNDIGGSVMIVPNFTLLASYKKVLGEEWLDNRLFRLGTSRLANLLLSDIKGEEIKFF